MIKKMIDKWFLDTIKIGWLDDSWDLKLVCVNDNIPLYSEDIVDYIDILKDPNTVDRWKFIIKDPESFFVRVVDTLNGKPTTWTTKSNSLVIFRQEV